MKKLYYLSTIIFPNHRAHGVQVMKTCEAFSKFFEVVLYAGGLRSDRDDIFRYYQIQSRFGIRSVKTFRGRFKMFSDVIAAIRYARMMRQEPDAIYYTRDRGMAFILMFLNKNFFCEIHSLPPRSRFLIRILGRRVRGLISTNNAKKETMVAWGISRERITVAPNGVDLALFDGISTPASQLRNELGLPQGKTLIGFIGRFEQRGDSKGIQILFDAIQAFDDASIIFCFIGGTEEEIRRHREVAHAMGIVDRCFWKEAVSFEKVPKYMKAMDFLFLAHKKTLHLSYYASAVKVFEYMASQRPIIISRTPAIQEVLPEDAAFYFEPENPEDVVRAIQVARENPEEAASHAGLARAAVERYTWQKRAERIAEFLKKISP